EPARSRLLVFAGGAPLADRRRETPHASQEDVKAAGRTAGQRDPRAHAARSVDLREHRKQPAQLARRRTDLIGVTELLSPAQFRDGGFAVLVSQRLQVAEIPRLQFTADDPDDRSGLSGSPALLHESSFDLPTVLGVLVPHDHETISRFAPRAQPC